MRLEIDGVNLDVEISVDRLDGQIDEMYVYCGDQDITAILSEDKLDEIQSKIIDQIS